jgi:hypothetical protein
MQSLSSAKEAIKAELAHVRQGAEYYQSLASALEEALAKLESVEADGAENIKPRGRKRGAVKKVAKRGRPAGRPSKSSGEKLPPTGMEFWLKLISDEPKSAGDILNAAVSELGIEPNDDQMKKLSQRQTYALNTLVKENKIADSGARRTRRFFVRGMSDTRH